MRLTHLTEEEIQAFLDLRDMRDKRGLSREEALEFNEKQEHVETCIDCQEKIHEYEFLFEDMLAPALCEVKLPRSFARKTTLRIPPFAAAYARATIRMWSGIGAAAAILLGWWLWTINWSLLAGQLMAKAVPLFAGVQAALTNLIARLPIPATSFFERFIPSFDFDWSYILAAAIDVLGDPLVIVMAVLAGAVSLAFHSVDDIILADILNRRKH